MKKLISIKILLFFTVLMPLNTYSISHAVYSQKDYNYSIVKLRMLRIIMSNFGSIFPDKSISKEHKQIQALFKEASEQFYGQNFVKSAAKFKKLKMDLIILYEKIAKNYLNRTKAILDSTSKQSLNILIQYSKKSELAKYFRKPFDPLTDKKAYDPKKFHYFLKNQKINNYIKKGYKKYHEALYILKDREITFLKRRKVKTHAAINFIIDKYSRIIVLCRLAKQCGLEIHKILNHYKYGEILIKYNLKSQGITPIFDDRIPDQFKVDANDNVSFVHSHELNQFKKRTGKDHPSKNVKQTIGTKEDKNKNNKTNKPGN